MDLDRQKRQQDIRKALGFIQSSLPYPDPQGYGGFLTQLVCNLLEEGSTAFSEGAWKQAIKDFSEGVNVAYYAQAESLDIPSALLESLYVKRAAAYQSVGENEQCVQDCDKALALNEGSCKALHRKALCLRELGHIREAYDCSMACLLSAPNDKQVNKLAQELANKLGLKIRKAYISTHVSIAFLKLKACVQTSWQLAFYHNRRGFSCPQSSIALSYPVWYSDMASIYLSNQTSHFYYGLCLLIQASPHCDFPPVAPSATGGPKLLQFPSGLPAPTPRLPPAFFYSAVSQLNSLDTFPGVGGGDSAGTLDSLDTLNDLDSLSGLAGDDAPASKTVFDSLDALDSFSPPEGTLSANPVVVVKNGQMGSKFPQLTYNPLAATHDFKQACATCYSWIGPGVLDYKHQEHLAHRCQQNILLCRIKALPHPVWNRVRPRPAKQNFTGAFMLCKEVLESQVCKYGEDCTFAYCQEEVDVWTLERKEVLNRELLFERQGPNDKTTLSITRLLQLQNGMFMYLCGVCYDSRPRIISKRSKEVPSICSNLAGRHHFDDQKCLVHVVRSSSMSYTRIRPLNPLCQLEMCRRAVRYRCQRDHSCSFAHSVIELECWKLQQDNGITHEEIVQESKQHWNKQEQNAHKQKTQTSSSSSGGGSETRRGGKGGGGNKLNLNMKYVCGLCWRDGLISEADKALKYCTAKARHSWTKDRRVLLVKSLEKKKWVMVRTLPAAKTYPHQYDICSHVVKLKKCHYIGNCTFAHSEEEKEVWTYMKNNGLKDMQQMYDIWLTMTKQNRQSDPVLAQNTEVKQIVMPTDYADPMVRKSTYSHNLSTRHVCHMTAFVISV
uniref:C3H1-type domain-containing protein n=1 Tax=Esox lucius TaxID=8010 RepID=A0AAY5L6Y9_ESOLU